MLTLVVVVGKIVSVTLGAFLTGGGVRTSVQAGMSLAQIGEFSFIIAGVGATLGATRDFLYPVAVAVSAVTTLLTPWLIRAAAPVAGFVDRKLPRALQTFVALYGSWIERLRRSDRGPGGGAAPVLRRFAWRLVVDGVALAAIVIGASISGARLAALLESRGHVGADAARAGVLVAAAALSLPFLVGIVRVARRLGVTLALHGVPRGGAGRRRSGGGAAAGAGGDAAARGRAAGGRADPGRDPAVPARRRDGGAGDLRAGGAGAGLLAQHRRSAGARARRCRR